MPQSAPCSGPAFLISPSAPPFSSLPPPLLFPPPRDQLPCHFHPLVVFVPLPIKHNRLASALQKSTVLLKWKADGAGPSLTGVVGYQTLGYGQRLSLDNSRLYHQPDLRVRRT